MYTADHTQMAFLRLLSRLVHQNITYHCQNSRAWDENTMESVKLIGNDMEEIRMNSPRLKPIVHLNECNVSQY